MKIELTVRRSKEWLAAQRLATGENVPEDIKVSVDPADLGQETRKFLLASTRKGEYTDHVLFRFTSDYNWWYGGGFGIDMLQIDCDTPTAADIDQAVFEMCARLVAKRTKHTKEEAARAEAKRLEQEAAAEKARKLAEARELLKGELGEWQLRVYCLNSDREVLAKFLTYVPNDAKRGALKSYAAENVDIADCRQEIEDASPYEVFEEDEEDDVE